MPTKNRQQLKAFFVKNAIPTESNFADLVDSQLNQADDGVFKPAGEPLSVVATGDQRRALRLYGAFPAQAPDWQLALNPRQAPADASTSKPGLGVTDGAGALRLFIDAKTGKLGVGTNQPHDLLSVQSGDLRVEGGAGRRVKVVSDAGDVGVDLVARQKDAPGNPYIKFTHGELDALDFGTRIVGADTRTLRVEAGGNAPVTLHVKGALSVDAGAVVRGALAVQQALTAEAGVTVQGDVSLATGRLKAAVPGRVGLCIDRTSQHLALPPLKAELPFHTGFTFQAWVYASALRDGDLFFTALAVDNHQELVQIGLRDAGRLSLRVSTPLGDATALTPTPVLAPGVWTHLACSVTPDGTVRFFKNGALVHTTSQDTPKAPRAVLRNVATVSMWYEGNLHGLAVAEVALWAKAQTAVTSSGLAGDEPGLVGYWKLDKDFLDSCKHTPSIGPATPQAAASRPAPGLGLVEDRPARPLVAAERWIPATMLEPYSWRIHDEPVYGPVGFFKDALGTVHLRGIVTNNTDGPVGNVVLFSLPPGYRPEFPLVAVCAHAGGSGRIDVRPDGAVAIAAGHGQWTSLDNIHFRAFA